MGEGDASTGEVRSNVEGSIWTVYSPGGSSAERKAGGRGKEDRPANAVEAQGCSAAGGIGKTAGDWLCFSRCSVHDLSSFVPL